jgi:hypothetical protein
MADGEDVGNDWLGAVKTDVGGDPGLCEPVGEEDQRGD